MLKKQTTDKIGKARDKSEEIKPYIEKLALLLHRLKTPDEIKKAWANLVPAMSVKQIEQLINILEK